MGNAEKVEKHGIKDVLRTDRFLEVAGGLFSEFVPTYENTNETILPFIVIPHKKGDIKVNVSGTRDDNGLLEEGRLYFIRNGKQWNITVNALGMQSYSDMKERLKVMRIVAYHYEKSNLPRKVTA